SHLPRTKGKYDTVLGHSGIEEFSGDSILCSVPLNPEFAIPNIYVDETGMNAPKSFSPRNHEELVFSCLVKYCLILNVGVSIIDHGYSSLRRLTLRLHISTSHK